MKEKDIILAFNEKVNNFVKGSMRIENNAYGAKFEVGFPDQIISETKTKLAKRVPTMLDFQNGVNESPTRVDVTPGNFEKYFEKNSFTYEELCALVLTLKKTIVKNKIDSSKNDTTATSVIASVVHGDYEMKTVTFEFFSNSVFGNRYTDADKDFIFRRIYKDSDGNLYMKLCDKLFRLELKPNSERTLLGNTLDVNTQFWPAFFKEFQGSLDKWNAICQEAIQTFDFEDSKVSVEQVLMERGVPRIYLECHKLSIKFKGVKTDKKTMWVFDNADLVLNKEGSLGYSMQNMIEVFSRNLITALDVTKTQEIPLFSNDPNEIAIKHLSMPKANDLKKEPKLPEAWEKFLGGDRFYDKFMDKMKIACFVHNILNAKYSGRQILVIGGEGEDGKGVFLDILDKIIGHEFSVNVHSNAFSVENQFGLENTVNKKLVYLSDCKAVSKLFSEDKFKAMSGGDRMSINRKNLKEICWTPKGLCIAIATNNNFFVNSEHGRSRTMPLVFRKNFTRKEMIDKSQMEMMLLSEKEEFLQWCVDYRQWLNHVVCKDRLLKGSTLLICTDEDMVKIAKGLGDDPESPEAAELTTFALFKNVCEKQMLHGSRFCNWNDRTEAEEDMQADFNEIMDNEIFHGADPVAESKDGVKYYTAKTFAIRFNNFFVENKNLCVSIGIGAQITPHTKCFSNWVRSRFLTLKHKRVNGEFYKTLLVEKPEPDASSDD